MSRCSGSPPTIESGISFIGYERLSTLGGSMASASVYEKDCLLLGSCEKCYSQAGG